MVEAQTKRVILAKLAAADAAAVFYGRCRRWMTVTTAAICVIMVVKVTAAVGGGLHKRTTVRASNIADAAPVRAIDLEYAFFMRPTIETAERKPELPKDGWELEGAKFLTLNPAKIEIVYYYRSMYRDLLQGVMEWNKLKNPDHGEWSSYDPEDPAKVMAGKFDLIEVAPLHFQGTKTGIDMKGREDRYMITLRPKSRRSTQKEQRSARVTELEWRLLVQPALGSKGPRPDLGKKGWEYERAQFLTYRPDKIEIVFYFRSMYRDRLQGVMEWNKLKNPDHGEWSAPNPDPSARVQTLGGKFWIREADSLKFEGMLTGYDNKTGKNEEFNFFLVPK